MSAAYERMARFYDLFYAHLRTDAWVDFLEFAFATHAGGGAVRSVLEVGCGTGRILLPLAERGYSVRGVDRSEAMLARLAEKAAAAGLEIPASIGDMRELREVLDRDEFEAAGKPEELARRALLGLRDLERAVRSREWPFGSPASPFTPRP